jgi:hypothetical protein
VNREVIPTRAFASATSAAARASRIRSCTSAIPPRSAATSRTRSRTFACRMRKRGASSTRASRSVRGAGERARRAERPRRVPRRRARALHPPHPRRSGGDAQSVDIPNAGY